MSESTGFTSPEEVERRLAAVGYVADAPISTTVYLAERMNRPLLVEGPAGVGKTELAKALATVLGTDFLRLQCYEGLDEAKALYEWEYPKQLLYAQMLRDQLAEKLAGAASLGEAIDRIAATDDAFFSERFLVARPLLQAIRSARRVVLLIDEIDRAEAEFEAFLLEVLSDFQVTVPELGPIRAAHLPLVVLTSNNARELSDALKRRCLHLYIDYPDASRELDILRRRLPDLDAGLSAEVVRAVQSLRTLDLKKRPSVSETIDWARALALLNVDTLTAPVVERTLSLLLKYRGDVAEVRERLEDLLDSPPAKMA